MVSRSPRPSSNEAPTCCTWKKGRSTPPSNVCSSKAGSRESGAGRARIEGRATTTSPPPDESNSRRRLRPTRELRSRSPGSSNPSDDFSMLSIGELARRVRYFVRRDQMSAELEEEMRFRRDLRESRLREAGPDQGTQLRGTFDGKSLRTN